MTHWYFIPNESRLMAIRTPSEAGLCEQFRQPSNYSSRNSGAFDERDEVRRAQWSAFGGSLPYCGKTFTMACASISDKPARARGRRTGAPIDDQRLRRHLRRHTGV